jgi:hypothetical protein
MANKKDKRTTKIYEKLHRKQKVEQHEPYKTKEKRKWGLISGAPE